MNVYFKCIFRPLCFCVFCNVLSVFRTGYFVMVPINVALSTLFATFYMNISSTYMKYIVEYMSYV